MDGATSAVIGAAIGALGGLTGGWFTVLGQRSQHRAEQDRWQKEMRRQAYTNYIAVTKQLSAAQWRMSSCLWHEPLPDQWEAAFREVHDAWAEFSSAAAAVTVAGPRTAADAADVVRTAMSDIQDSAMAWLTAAREAGHGQLEDFNSRFTSAAKAKRKPDKDFQAAARAALDAET
ncbi:hypothetical protein ACFVU0_26820 [Streptomyces sp. NPDC058122]|uniref:hypothetical protein n=1 Tax=Streptomyces sp. NPDC058122 TaxID=3346349 RepID=UPI0036E7A674